MKIGLLVMALMVMAFNSVTYASKRPLTHHASKLIPHEAGRRQQPHITPKPHVGKVKLHRKNRHLMPHAGRVTRHGKNTHAMPHPVKVTLHNKNHYLMPHSSHKGKPLQNNQDRHLVLNKPHDVEQHQPHNMPYINHPENNHVPTSPIVHNSGANALSTVKAEGTPDKNQGSSQNHGEHKNTTNEIAQVNDGDSKSGTQESGLGQQGDDSIAPTLLADGRPDSNNPIEEFDFNKDLKEVFASQDGSDSNIYLHIAKENHKSGDDGIEPYPQVDPSKKPELGHNSQMPPPAVPVPAALWLFGAGLLGLVGVRRKKS